MKPAAHYRSPTSGTPQGFTELVGWVCSGQVGAVFGIEISRLARSSAEVAKLTEFAAITRRC